MDFKLKSPWKNENIIIDADNETSILIKTVDYYVFKKKNI